jgi:hypothetical protein
MNTQRYLTIYSGAITGAFPVTLLGGFAPQNKKSTFDEITVQRINVVEPDGTLRMVISNKAHLPGFYIKGKEHPHPDPGDRPGAGMLFFDDEGTENGGLIFGGLKDKDGKVSSVGHLSFDQYMQDQVFSIDAGEDNGKRWSGIGINDRPDFPISEELEMFQRTRSLPPDERKAEIEKFFDQKGRSQSRLRLEREADRSVALRLRDVEGRDRIVIMVKPDGSPILEFRDEHGKVFAQLPQVQK